MMTDQVVAAIRCDRTGTAGRMTWFDARAGVGIADQVATAPGIDMAGSANLVARVQADLTSRVAEEPVATFGIRTRLITSRADARLATATCFGNVLTPGHAFTATERVARGTAGTEWIVRETPGVWGAHIARIRRPAAASPGARRASRTVTVSTKWLNRDAGRSWAEEGNRLAIGIRAAGLATDAFRAENVTPNCGGAAATATATTACRIRAAEVVARLAHFRAILAGSTLANLALRAVFVGAAVIAPFAPAALGICRTVGIRAALSTAPLLATMKLAALQRVAAGFADHTVSEAARFLVLAGRLAGAADAGATGFSAFHVEALADIAILAFAAFLIATTTVTGRTAIGATRRSFGTFVTGNGQHADTRNTNLAGVIAVNV